MPAAGQVISFHPPVIAARLQNAAGLAIDLLENGTIHAIRHGDILVNQVLGSPLEGGLGNVHLRRRTRAGVTSAPLLGPAAGSRFRASAEGAIWDGSVDGIEYSLSLRLAPAEATWFWTIGLVNASGRRRSVDVVLAQDLGIANEAAVRTNELYTSQYIDHTIFSDEDLGFVICSRQNLVQGTAFPWVAHGCLDGAVGYLTDGFQFHGLGYRASNVPAALGRRRLPNRRDQYEFAFPTLQSRAVVLQPGASSRITFFAAFAADHPEASSTVDLDRARAAGAVFVRLPPVTLADPPQSHARPRARGVFDSPVLFDSHDLDRADLERFFGPDWRHVERHDGAVLSFFHGRQQHVVLRAKELMMERPTGHIMRSGRDLLPSDSGLSVTTWMCGVFGSQVTIGNTSFNKLLGVVRNPLNVLKTSGQRIVLRTDRGDELLGLPSAFEMGPNSARWIYHDRRFTIAIRVTASLDAPACRLTVEVIEGGPVELLISHHVVLGENEDDRPGTMAVDAAAGRIELRPDPASPLRRHYPDATFFVVAPEPERVDSIGGDGLTFDDGADRGGSHLVVKTTPVNRFSLVLTGSVVDAGQASELAEAYGRGRDPDAGLERASGQFWSALAQQANLGGATGRRAGDLARLNDAFRWNVHDALIHGSAPHGLEQYSGAAWGLRDVCQGPAEFLAATGHLDDLRAILRIVYGRQDRQTGDWPQWFMIDRYRDIQAPDSHGDVIYWPLKALCDYVEATGDVSILDDRIGYDDGATDAAATESPVIAGLETIFAHTARQIAAIERDCIPGTALAVFGGGDWEDTLQPVDPAVAGRLVSAWTVELAYQTLDRYRTVCERAGRQSMADRLADLCGRMRADFQSQLIPDGIVAGLAEFRPDGIRYLLHPRDRMTGVAYRLLPMTRGILSGMFTPEQAKAHADLIERHLLFPDGVRLMNRPMDYHGGTSRIFRRAESAANFGREVGLMYVHAHIRYIEAMARLGRPDEALRGLLAICPIGLEGNVPSALPRQCNAFFSSSDAAFRDRYQASRQFGRIRSGRVGLRGGWRVYSSGPGILINQLISNVLGLRAFYDDLVFDPVLPRDADGLTFDFDHEGRPVRYLFHVAGDGFSPRRIDVNGRRLVASGRLPNPYRPGGLLVSKRDFRGALDPTANLVEIFV